MEVKRIVFVVCLFVAIGNCLPSGNANSKTDELSDTYGDLIEKDVQNDDIEDYGTDDDGNEDSNDTPKPEKAATILTKGQVVVAKVGDTVMLPCEVSDPNVVTVWQKDGTLIYQGHIAIGKMHNTLELSNGTLEVNITSEKDLGSYACILMVKNEDNTRPEVVHKIVMATPPRIEKLVAENNKTEYTVGENLILTCVASGYPKPEISWHRGSERLAIHGETLIISDLKVQDAGVYRCLADNKIKNPSHQHITIHVEHAPIIKIEKYLVNADHETEAELTCTVDAFPEAHVVWKKNNKNIVSKDRVKVTVKKHQTSVENVLVIGALEEGDFGTYVCFAKNGRGKAEAQVKLVRTPAVREFIKPEKVTEKDVVLTWKVESRLPISMHEIQYRKRGGDDQWQTAKPEVNGGEGNMYTVKYTLKDLEAGSYETRVRSKNEHGWSEFSDIIPFEGGSPHKNHNKKHHKEKKEKHIASTQGSKPAQHQEITQKEASVGASQSSGDRLSMSSSLLSMVLILIWANRQ